MTGVVVAADGSTAFAYVGVVDVAGIEFDDDDDDDDDTFCSRCKRGLYIKITLFWEQRKYMRYISRVLEEILGSVATMMQYNAETR